MFTGVKKLVYDMNLTEISNVGSVSAWRHLPNQYSYTKKYRRQKLQIKQTPVNKLTFSNLQVYIAAIGLHKTIHCF